VREFQESHVQFNNALDYYIKLDYLKLILIDKFSLSCFQKVKGAWLKVFTSSVNPELTGFLEMC